MRIIERKNTKLITLLTQVETLYKTTDKRRGLLNAVGSVSKILFGTMDADDQKLIDEQLQTLRTNGKVLQHAVANQIKVINATIAHLDKLENTLNYNENLIMSATKRLEQRLTESTLQADVDEHLLILTTIMNDLTKDTENVIDYLTYGKNGMIPTRLPPIKHIITALKEAATQLTMGLHFPFKIQIEHWQTIHTYITFSAYSDGPYIYTILRFPVVAYPTFKLIKAIPLPVHDHANVFAYIKINHPLLAIDKENHHYKLLEEVERTLHTRNKHIHMRTELRDILCGNNSTMRGANIYTYTGTAQVLRKELYDI
ncbi:hypothetical protein P5V15_003022 [Pogonomyrmex californicus]